ncbi:hypothetical protein M5K25_010246 [Dendrobium thyrsiflorum]|uniref:CCHC-type domain-containing protein n=1 Tax=Dendrobium thyrsiflorum TaxID=117978 RepID=A0ABD0V0C1_DENTH
MDPEQLGRTLDLLVGQINNISQQLRESQADFAEFRRTTTDRSNPGTKCFRCQGYGHIASQCSSPYKVSIIEEITEDDFEPEVDQVHQIEDEGDFFEEDDDTAVLHCLQKLDTSPICVVRCALSHPTPTDDWRRTAIFHTYTKIKDKNCKVIVDSGSCINAVSSSMVSKLGLSPVPHPIPYKPRGKDDTKPSPPKSKAGLNLVTAKVLDSEVAHGAPLFALVGREHFSVCTLT